MQFPNSWGCSLFSTCSLLFFLPLLFGTTAQAVINLPPGVTIPAVFMFGDSLVDSGNNNNRPTISKANYRPYGKDLGRPTGRFSNGRIIPDLFVEELGIKELLPAYLDPNLKPADLPTGVNFASGGAGYDPLTSQVAGSISLSGQVNLLREYIGKLKGLVGDERASTILANSLFLVLAGGNDITNTYYSTPTRRVHYDISSYTDLMVSLASSFVQELYKLGARRIGVFGIPPAGCSPAERTVAGGPHRNCVGKYNQAAELFNQKLSAYLPSLNSNFPDARLVYIDAYSLLFDIIVNPQNYGFEVADRGCCGTGLIEVIILCNLSATTCPDTSKYVFWDGFHPTERAYQLMFQSILKENFNSFL